MGRARALVAGFGECGTRQDVDVLLPFLEHPSPRVRAQAVRAVRRLDGPLTQIAGMLADSPPHVRLGAYDQLCDKDTWTRVHVNLHLLAARDPKLSNRAWGRMGGSGPPAGGRASTLRRCLMAAYCVMSRSRRWEIRSGWSGDPSGFAEGRSWGPMASGAGGGRQARRVAAWSGTWVCASRGGRS